VCGEVVLDASASGGVGGAGRALLFSWAVDWQSETTTASSDALAAHAALHRALQQLMPTDSLTATVELPWHALVPGVRYTFRVRATNWLGRTGTAVATVLKAATDTPSLTLVGGAAVTVSRDRPAVLTALVQLRCGFPLLPLDTGLLCAQQSALTCAVLVRSGAYTFNSSSGSCHPTPATMDIAALTPVALQWSVMGSDGAAASLATMAELAERPAVGVTRSTLWVPAGRLAAGWSGVFQVTAARRDAAGVPRLHTAATAQVSEISSPPLSGGGRF
jgi:hypothetical protein